MKRKNLLLYKKFLIGTFVSVIGANLSGCGKTNEYVAPKNGTIAYSGEINYSDFKTIKLIQITNHETEENEYYFVKVFRDSNDNIIYTDIETGIKINYENSYVVIDNMHDYLEDKNIVSPKYNIDEFERLKEIIFSDEELNITKKPETLKRTLDY